MKNMISMSTDASVAITHFEIKTPRVKPGEDLAFTFTLQNSAGTPVHLDIHYEILCPDQDGVLFSHSYPIASRKCPAGFLLYNQNHQMTETVFPPDRAQENSLLPFPGSRTRSCRLHLLINGRVLADSAFELVV